ncbi:MAG: TM2 domain-containing protein [Lachnospiraceae bacterium]|nr:TM2 domain-containing protein [Lachnospiraceae bacterium]
MYFCKHCGAQYVTDEANICVHCGTAKGQGANFCRNCGSQMDPNAANCMKCGVANSSVAKSKIVAGILGLFLGSFGAHNFYLGYTGKAVTQLVLSLVGYVLCCVWIGIFVVAGVAIWALVEAIMILVGKINTDAKGNPLAD